MYMYIVYISPVFRQSYIIKFITNTFSRLDHQMGSCSYILNPHRPVLNISRISLFCVHYFKQKTIDDSLVQPIIFISTMTLLAQGRNKETLGQKHNL